MSFFNLTYVGNQNTLKEYKLESSNYLPPINCPRIYQKQFSKPFNSNLYYHEIRTKHIRDPRSPNEIYSRPVTCSQDYGWWTKHGPLSQSLSWTDVKKCVYPKSEMTSFADRMILSDKSFKMY